MKRMKDNKPIKGGEESIKGSVPVTGGRMGIRRVSGGGVHRDSRKKRGGGGSRRDIEKRLNDSVDGFMSFGEWLEGKLILESDDMKTIDDFKNPNEFYRIIVGDDAYNDIVHSGQVRTESPTYKGVGGAEYAGKINIGSRPTAFPSFSRGSVNLEYALNNKNHYVIVTSDPSIMPSNIGRHGKGTTHFPTDEGGNHLKSLDAIKVKVYKHLGDGQYKLVYSGGREM